MVERPTEIARDTEHLGGMADVTLASTSCVLAFMTFLCFNELINIGLLTVSVTK